MPVSAIVRYAPLATKVVRCRARSDVPKGGIAAIALK
jgi:hypothetical protein